MTEADILALTYIDSCTVSRKASAVKDPVDKISRQETVTVAADVPCALSSPYGGGVDFSGGHGSFQKNYTLFCRPDVDIRAGDKLVISTADGRSYTLWAGRPYAYHKSHMAVPAWEDERT